VRNLGAKHSPLLLLINKAGGLLDRRMKWDRMGLLDLQRFLMNSDENVLRYSAAQKKD